MAIMATNPNGASVPANDASMHFPDLFGTIDGLFSRYVQFQKFQNEQSATKAIKAQNDVLNQLSDQQAQTATSGLSTIPKEYIILGGFAVVTLLLLMKR